MTAAQNNSFSGTVTAAGSETINISDDNDVTTLAGIETYVVGDTAQTNNGTFTVTISEAGTSVTSTDNGDAVTFDIGTLDYTGTITGEGTTADKLKMGTGSSIAGGTVNAVEDLELATGASVTMLASQHAGFSGTVTAAGTTGGDDGETITLSGGGNVTAFAAVETYVLGDEGRTITLADAGQNVTGGNGADTINTATLATLTGIINGGTGANKLVTGANLDISGAASFSNIQSIEIGGDFTLDVTRAQLDAIAITQTTGTSATVRIASDGANADQFDLAGSASLDITASDVAIAFLDGNAPSAVRTLVLGKGSSLNLTAAQAATAGGELTISDGESDGEDAAVVTVEQLELLTSANLSRITVDTLRAEVAVSGTTVLHGDLNNSALAITSVASTPTLDLTAAGSVDSIDFNDLALEVVLTTTQYTENDGLFVADVANTQTVQLVNGTTSLATVTQLSGIETYKLNASTNAGHITFNTLEADASVNLTRLDDAGATVTIAVDGAATFDGIWSGFVAGDTLAIAGTGAIVVNVESVTNDGSTVSLGGIDTITVDTDDTLQVAAAQLNGAGVTGAGTTVVRSLETSGADLSSVNSTAVSLDVTAGDASVDAGFRLGAGRAYSVIGGKTFNLTAATSLGLDAASSFVIAASTGLIADAADLNQVATSSDGSTTVRGLIGSTANLSELITTTVTLDIESANADVSVGFVLAGRAYNVVGTGELDLTNATLSTSASYVLGSGTDLRINAADVTNVSITDTGSDSSVVVEALEVQADADLTKITASSITASVVVANTVALTGDLNGADLVIASVSGTPVLDVTGAGTIESLDFGDNAAKVIISAKQYAALSSISNLAGSPTIEIVDATNDATTDVSVTQIAGIEAYELNPTGADDDITFNLVAAGASANLTRNGSTAATVTLSAGETANFSGTWTSFATGDVLNIVTSATVNVEGVSAGADLGGLQTVGVGSGANFIAKAGQISGAAITGAGTVNVTALDDAATANLGNITTTTVTAAVGLSDETVTFTGNLGKAAVTITGTSAGADDIFNVDGATMGTATFSVGANAILQGSAAQLSGVTATGSGTTAVTALHSALAADLSGIDTTTTTAAFDGDGTFTGILDGAVVTVGDGFTMTAAANVVAGETINKASTGALAVRVGFADAAVDLTTIGGTALSSVTVFENTTFTGTLDDTVSTSVDAGVTLTIAASKVSGKVVTGAGAIIVQGVDANTDLTNVNPGGGVIATLEKGINISGNANLGNVDNFSIDNDADVTMTIVQHAKISAAAGDNTVTLSANGTIMGNTLVENYILAAGNNNFTMANAGQQVTGNINSDNITGGLGNDVIFGGAGSDILSGGLGNDIISGGQGGDILTGGDGADTFVFASGDTSTVFANDVISDFTSGEDKFDFGQVLDNFVIADGVAMALSDFLANASAFFAVGQANAYIAYNVGDIGNGLIAVDHNQDGVFGAGDSLVQLIGVNSAATINANDFTGSVTQVGTSGNDSLAGTAGDDVIFGGIGDDVITSNGGNDRLAGGPGADTFVISDGPGTVTILDFGEGDTLDFSAFNLPGTPTFTQSGSGDTQIALDADTFLIIEGYDPSELTAYLAGMNGALIVI